MRKFFVSVVAITLSLLACHSSSPVWTATAGALDWSFGNRGIQLVDLFSTPDQVGLGLAFQPDGKILFTGYRNLGDFLVPDARFTVGRLNTDGGLDPTFLNNGYLPSLANKYSLGAAVLFDKLSRISIVGVCPDPVVSHCGVRLTAQGFADPTWGNNGIATLGAYAFPTASNAGAFQSDGKLVVAGFTVSANDYYPSITRFTADGVYDAAFGVPTVAGMTKAMYTDVAIDDRNRIFVAGYNESVAGTSQIILNRFLSDGTQDPAYTGNKQFNITDNKDYAQAMARQPDGKILFSGQTTLSMDEGYGLIGRVLENGTLDTSFGDNGKVVFSNLRSCRSMKLLPDGKILVGGSIVREQRKLAYVMRLLPDGQIDKSFGKEGKTEIAYEDYNHQGIALAISNNGKAALIGNLSPANDFAVSAPRVFVAQFTY